MRTRWQAAGQSREVASPVSLVVTALAPIDDVRQGRTPYLMPGLDSSLILVDLAAGKQRLGGSILAQVINQFSGAVPDLDEPQRLAQLNAALQVMRQEELVLAYHDRSDGGLFATLAEMCFASHCGMAVNLDMLTIDPYSADWGDFKIRPEQVAVQRNELTLKALFNEELGVVLQVPTTQRNRALAILREHGLSMCSHVIGKPNDNDTLEFYRDAKQIGKYARTDLQRLWMRPSGEIAKLRDDPQSVASEMEHAPGDTGRLSLQASFDVSLDIAAPFVQRGARPRVAILREQGVNGQIEMAGAFTRAGFDAFDVHMSDLVAGRHKLRDFQALAACGGFSYGDVLGAGTGWARSILFNAAMAESFAEFFARPDTLSLGVCNGCQMLSQLKAIIPGAEHWPRFLRNQSQQYEARLVMVEVLASPSAFMQDMAGSRMPIVVAHGEGRAEFANPTQQAQAHALMRFIDHTGHVAQAYPMNPNGSIAGLAGFTSQDGRSTILMPHPERCFRSIQMSWHPSQSGEPFVEDSPWMRIFRNARVALG